MNPYLAPNITRNSQCEDGTASIIKGNPKWTFRCNNIDLLDYRSHKDLGSRMGFGSSSWGWTSPEGREFMAVAQQDGAAFMEIASDGKIKYLGRLPQHSKPSIWREIRGFKDYMVIGSEAEGHGIQIFDMKKLLDIDPATPKVFTQDALTGHYDELPVGKTHNVVVNEEADFIYSVGAVPRFDECKSGLIFINMTDPANPKNEGCAPQAGYVHDAQCLIYRGPDTRYVGREICYAYNEQHLVM
jgi:choice-of-anchor B domain-containing protein